MGGMMSGGSGGMMSGGGTEDALPDTEPVNVDAPEPEPMMGSTDVDLEIDIPGDGGIFAGDEDDDGDMELY